MHILIIPSWYSTPTNPVRGIFFREQALALQEAGHQVGMLIPPSRFRTWHGLREFIRNWRLSNTEIDIINDSGIVTYRIPWWGWWPTLSATARGKLAVKVFDRYSATQGRPDLIHAHSVLYGGYLAACIKGHCQVPVVLTEHLSVLLSGPIWPDQKPLIRYTLSRADKVLAVSQPLAAALSSYLAGLDVEVLGNAVDTQFFVPGEPIPLEPFIFTLVAGLNRNKGVDVLLQAFSQAFKGEKVLLKLAGSDAGERANLERLTQDLGIQNQVEFLGVLPREAVRDLMQQSHVVVSSSYIETFGLSLVEAMACGKPVIATRSGGPESFVTEQNGLLVPTGDPDALAQAMRTIRRNYMLYDPATIRNTCITQYSKQAITRRLEEVYKSLLLQL